jgi:DNA-binding XRE family transcriptional regulator
MLPSVFSIKRYYWSGRGRDEPTLIERLLNQTGQNVNRNSIKLEKGQLVTTRQIKAARALLGWSQATLAQRSGVSEPTIARLESEDGQLGGREGTGDKIRTAIEAAGVDFVEENGGGLGVRLRKRSRLRMRPNK